MTCLHQKNWCQLQNFIGYLLFKAHLEPIYEFIIFIEFLSPKSDLDQQTNVSHSVFDVHPASVTKLHRFICYSNPNHKPIYLLNSWASNQIWTNKLMSVTVHSICVLHPASATKSRCIFTICCILHPASVTKFHWFYLFYDKDKKKGAQKSQAGWVHQICWILEPQIK